MKSNKILKIIAIIAFIATITTAQTSTIWDGTADTTWFTDNKEATEFTITTAEQLAGLAILVNGSANNGTYNMAEKTIKLGANIMLNDTTDWRDWQEIPPENIWLPIGTRDAYFNGIFDGNGHTITGLYAIRLGAGTQAGFFGYADSIEIKNINVVGAYVYAPIAGGLVGQANYISIINSSYTGIVNGANGGVNTTVGGLVGSGSRISIFNSWCMGTLNGEIVGGLIGSSLFHSRGGNSVNQSFFQGIISHNLETRPLAIGGLIGRADTTTITDSYAVLTLRFSRNTHRNSVYGAIIGRSDSDLRTSTSKIINSYSAFANIYMSDATALITGVFGRDTSNTTEVIRSYYQRGRINDAEGKTRDEMLLKATFADWDFDNIWGIDENINLGYPYLIALKEPVTPTSIKNIKKSDNRYGIRFANNIVSDKAEISVILPNNERIVETKIVVYDMTGNVVASTGSATDGTIVWDLRNRAGRFVANGSYLIIVEAKDRNGRTHIYSARLGVNR